MKIAVSSDGVDLNAEVGFRFGQSGYFVIVDDETMEFETVENPGASSPQASGAQAVVLVISRKADVVLTGFCSPTAIAHLTSKGIKVIDGVKGKVGKAVRMYKTGRLQKQTGSQFVPGKKDNKINRASLNYALKISTGQFAKLLPVLIGVVMLIGMFNSFMSKELLSSVFSGNIVKDTFLGACLGSVFAGNPINSYVIGGGLMKHGISMFAVTALIISWVTVGIVQLPAEITALGRKFALARNMVSFFLSIIIAVLTVVSINIIGG